METIRRHLRNADRLTTQVSGYHTRARADLYLREHFGKSAMHRLFCRTWAIHFALVAVFVSSSAWAQQATPPLPSQRHNVIDLRLVPVTHVATDSVQITKDESVLQSQGALRPGTYTFTDEIRQLRNRARLAARVPLTTPDGFSVSTADLEDIVAVFPALQPRPGFVLRGYEDRWDSNGVGFVRAFPLGQPAPLPGAVLPASARQQVSRAGLENSPMHAITGDGSAWSYLCASILAREFEEFGARWHGQSWVTHTLLTRDPWNAFPQIEDRNFYALRTDRDQWEWDQEELTDWRPRVQVSRGMIEVIFYTYSPLEQERIYRHEDTYQRGDYCAKTERTEIARGPQRMVF